MALPAFLLDNRKSGRCLAEFIYGERLDAFTVLGAALLLAGNLMNLKPSAPKPVQADV